MSCAISNANARLLQAVVGIFFTYAGLNKLGGTLFSPDNTVKKLVWVGRQTNVVGLQVKSEKANLFIGALVAMIELIAGIMLLSTPNSPQIKPVLVLLGIVMLVAAMYHVSAKDSYGQVAFPLILLALLYTFFDN